jgi:trigger factor
VDAPDRAAQMEDFIVIDFDGLVEGKPVAEVATNASKNLHGGKKFWVRLAPDNFLPKFCEQIVGQKKEETRTVTVDFAADFLVKELAGKQASYTVTLREIKEKVLPELNDEFAAKLLPGKTLAD